MDFSEKLWILCQIAKGIKFAVECYCNREKKSQNGQNLGLLEKIG